MNGKANMRADFGAGVFATTHWSVVLNAKDPASSLADEALERLCRAYWTPVYAYLRHEGHSVEDAQDLTQDFLSRLIEKQWLNHLRHSDGKFRSFLLTLLKHFLADEWDRANAQKRAGKLCMSLEDCTTAEDNYPHELTHGMTAEQIFERRWVDAVMLETARKLREEYAARGKAALFDCLKDLEPGEHTDGGYVRLAQKLGMSEPAFRQAAYEFRSRHREMLSEEIAHTVSDPRQVNDEIRHLLGLFSR
jgi:DNA-directed RNA polymerase specialized sigma24 family protein